MPYVKKSKKSYRKKSNVNTKINTLQKQVKLLIKTDEKKYLDTAVTGQEITTTAYDYSCNEIAQGDGFYNRDGQECVIKNVKFKGHITSPAFGTAQDANDALTRFILVKWSGSTGAIDDILTAPTNILSSYKRSDNTSNQKFYKILKDFQINVSYGSHIKKLFTINYTFKKGNTVGFNGTGTAAAVRNEVHLYILSESNDTSPDNPAVTFYQRTTFMG